MTCFLIKKYVIIFGRSLFWCELSDFWDFTRTDEEPHPLHCVVMTIFQGKRNPYMTLYGRLFHSVNEILRPVGEIFMYLFLR